MFVSTLSYEPLVRISRNLQLRSSWAQRWTDYSRSEGQRPRSQQDMVIHDWLIEQGLTSHQTHYSLFIGHIGEGFYGSNDPTNSVKALKEDRSKGLGFNPIRSTPPCSRWYNNYAVWNKKTQIHTNTNKSMHSEMCPVRQNPIQRTVRTAHLSVLMTVRNFSRPTQYNIEQFS